jgi:hypothetical protein
MLSIGVRIPYMNEEVRFEEGDFGRPAYNSMEDKNFIVRTLLKVRWVETETRAYEVIIGIVIVIMALSVFIFIRSGSNSPQSGEVPAGQIVP